MELKKLFKIITHSLIPQIKLGHSGRHNSLVVNNGFGKSEFKIELIAVEVDSEE
jgi:hypothetical protein